MVFPDMTVSIHVIYPHFLFYPYFSNIIQSAVKSLHLNLNQFQHYISLEESFYIC